MLWVDTNNEMVTVEKIKIYQAKLNSGINFKPSDEDEEMVDQQINPNGSTPKTNGLIPNKPIDKINVSCSSNDNSNRIDKKNNSISQINVPNLPVPTRTIVENPTKTCTILIDNLNNDTERIFLNEILSQFGKIHNFYIYNKFHQKTKYSIVKYYSDKLYNKIYELDEDLLFSNIIKIKIPNNPLNYVYPINYLNQFRILIKSIEKLEIIKNLFSSHVIISIDQDPNFNF